MKQNKTNQLKLWNAYLHQSIELFIIHRTDLFHNSQLKLKQEIRHFWSILKNLLIAIKYFIQIWLQFVWMPLQNICIELFYSNFKYISIYSKEFSSFLSAMILLLLLFC